MSEFSCSSMRSVFSLQALPRSDGSHGGSLCSTFAMNTGSGIAKSLYALVSMVASAVAGLPVVVGGALLGDVWLWLALPVGLAYGLGAALLGAYLAGDVLDHRQPELLAGVTPRR